MKLHAFVNEIFDIAHANNVSWDVGKDMFLANIRNEGLGALPHYAGADEVDFAALKPVHNELADSSENFVEIVRENYDEVVALRKDGKRDEIVALIGG